MSYPEVMIRSSQGHRNVKSARNGWKYLFLLFLLRWCSLVMYMMTWSIPGFQHRPTPKHPREVESPCVENPGHSLLKGLAQAKIIKKSLILFWLLNMTIWCKHVHRLELQKFFNFSAAHSPVRLDIDTKFLICNYWQPCQKLEIREFRLYI